MATTSRQDNDFADALIPGRDNLLEEAIEWINLNLSVDQVFGDLTTVAYVKENIEINQVFDERTILDYIQGNYSPEEVFEESEMVSWAEEHGYAKA